MRKCRFVPGLFLLLGAVGAVLRRVELATVFDPISGLPTPNAPVSVALTVLTALALVAAVAVALTARRKCEAPESFREAYPVKSPLTFGVMAVLGAVVTVCAALTFRGMRAGYWILNLAGPAAAAFVLLMALAGCGMILMAWGGRGSLDKAFLRLGSVMPALLCCYWMVAWYRVNAGNPVLLEYACPCLAFAAGAMGAFYGAGFAFGRRNLTATLWLSLMAVYLLPAAAMSPAPWFLRVPLVAMAAYFALQMGCLLSALGPKKAPEPEEQETSKENQE